MNKGWLELESDPGVFTLLVEDFGVEGVQVEEIYDLQKPIEGPVYGFIFLFRWTEDRRSRRKPQEDESFVVDDKIINSIFFAHQIISNSCATHALLSVLLNCESQIKLGDMLTRLKQFTRDMSPENKGIAISNMPDLAKAHNSHARPEPCRLPEKQQGISAGRVQEAFHFVSYVLVNGHLFELDGLKPYPIDHGPGKDNEEWTAKFFHVISERLGMGMQPGGEPSNDIRYALMAVVPDRRLQYEQKLKMLKMNRNTILEALRQAGKDESQPVNRRGRSSSAAAATLTGTCDANNTSIDSTVNFGMSTSIDPESSKTPRSLTVQTSFPDSSLSLTGPHSGGSSTDTASEVASLIHSPGELSFSSNNESLLDSKSLKSAFDEDTVGAENKADLESRLVEAARALNATELTSKVEGQQSAMSASSEVIGDQQSDSKTVSRQVFTAKELARLLKRVDDEISACENSRKDEIEKRRKYKIDDCRRTHNYDQFITTFLSMLAEQGQLASLVEQHMVTKRRQGFSVGRLHKKIRKTVEKKKRIRHKR